MIIILVNCCGSFFKFMNGIFGGSYCFEIIWYCLMRFKGFCKGIIVLDELIYVYEVDIRKCFICIDWEFLI